MGQALPAGAILAALADVNADALCVVAAARYVRYAARARADHSYWPALLLSVVAQHGPDFHERRRQLHPRILMGPRFAYSAVMSSNTFAYILRSSFTMFAGVAATETYDVHPGTPELCLPANMTASGWQVAGVTTVGAICSMLWVHASC